MTNIFILFLITYDAVMKRFLSCKFCKELTNRFTTISFIRFDNRWNWDTIAIYDNNTMDVVLHNHKIMNIYMRIIKPWNIYPWIVCNFPCIRQHHLIIYNLTKEMKTILCAKCQKISSSCRIVISFFTILFANRQCHTYIIDHKP